MGSAHIYKSNSEQETEALAARIAPLLRAGDVLFLCGDLGMGKSVFCRALIRTLCEMPDMTVPSPTYTLVQGYETEKAPVHHFDLYRLEAPEEVYELGWDDALYEGIALIEWPERLGPLAPPVRLDIVLSADHEGRGGRQIALRPQGGDWKERLGAL